MNKRDRGIVISVMALNVLWAAAVALLGERGQAGTVAKAYLDPGTGSLIISAIVGVVATIALGVKTFWYKLSRPFRRNKQPQPPGSGTPPQA